jgi:hypothetical protein
MRKAGKGPTIVNLARREHSAFPMSFRNIFLLAVIGVSANIGCRRPYASASDIVLREQITPQPVRTGPAAFSIQMADNKGKPVQHAEINVEGDMSHPGMAPIFSKAEEIAPGSYRAPIDFSMGGDWVILLHIHLANNRKLERQIDVRGVQSN